MPLNHNSRKDGNSPMEFFRTVWRDIRSGQNLDIYIKDLYEQ